MTTCQNKIVNLLQNQIGSIIQKEDGNQNMIHIYNAGNRWVTFEKSACLVESNFEFDHSVSVINYTCIPIKRCVMIDVPDFLLKALLHKYQIVEDGEEYKVISTSLSLRFFQLWKEKVID